MNLLMGLSQIPRRILYAGPFISATKNPYLSQKDVLLSIIKKNQETVYGKEHSFEKIASVADFQKLVSINSYSTLLPYLERMKAGDNNILTTEKPRMFAITSGTTGKSKFIPVTDEFIKSYKASWQNWIYFALKDHSGMFDKKIVTFVSPAYQGVLDSGIPYGSISGLLQDIQPEIVKKRYCLTPEVFRIKDYGARYYAISRIILGEDISLMITPNPGLILLICKKILEHQAELLDDIEHGSLSHRFDIEDDIRSSIDRDLQPNPARAQELRKIVKKHGKLDLREAWKDLVLVGCWKEGNMPLYLRQLPRFFGEVKTRDIGLMATEGRVTIPIGDTGGAGILSLTTSFFEFIPEEEREKKNPVTLTADKLEEGKTYYVVMTAPNGLYRYDLNDVVKVSGFYNKCPVIDFLHKGEHVTSIAGEKLSEWQAMTAVRHAAHTLSAPVDSFTACVHWGRPPRYAFHIEFHDRVTKELKARLIREIDKELKSLNLEYKTKRESMRLGHPILRHVKSGSYHKRHRHLVANGAHDAQVKHPCLVDDIHFEKQFREHLKIIDEVAVDEA